MNIHVHEILSGPMKGKEGYVVHTGAGAMGMHSHQDCGVSFEVPNYQGILFHAARSITQAPR